MYFKIHNILKVKANVKGIFPSNFLSADENFSDLEIVCNKKLNIEQFRNSLWEIMPGIYRVEGENIVISQFKILGIKIVIKLEFKKDKIIVEFTPSYKYVSRMILKMPIASLYPLEHFLKLVTQIQLLKKGYSFIITAGIVNDGKAILVSGFGGMGKTSTWKEILKSNDKYKYLGDDTILTDGNRLYSYPKPLRIREFGSVFFAYENHVDPKCLLKNKVANNCELEKIIFLERGKLNRIKSISKEESTYRIKAINSKIMPLLSERMILAAYYSGFLNLDELIRRQDEILEKLINDNSYIAESNEYLKTIELVNKNIKEK